jgi:hypothetical protein
MSWLSRGRKGNALNNAGCAMARILIGCNLNKGQIHYDELTFSWNLVITIKGGDVFQYREGIASGGMMDR